MSEFFDVFQQEFVDATTDAIHSLEDLLAQVKGGSLDPVEALPEFHRSAHSMKGRGATFGFPIITIIAHRLEDYLSGLKDLTDKQLVDVQTFLDRIVDVLEGRISADSADASSIVRSLPAKSSFDLSDITIMDVEVMLVMPTGAQTHFVERELQACGYRVTNVASTFSALEMVVRTRPDLVIASFVMPDLPGLDLACALKAMPSTAKIPVALITSFDRSHDSLSALPQAVPVIRKGGQFGDDLAEALSFLKIT